MGEFITLCYSAALWNLTDGGRNMTTVTEKTSGTTLLASDASPPKKQGGDAKHEQQPLPERNNRYDYEKHVGHSTRCIHNSIQATQEA